MKAGKTRQELEEALIEPILAIKRKRKVTNRIKKYLFDKHKIVEGNVQMWINNPQNELPNLDWRILYLFAEQVFNETRVSEINPDNYFTEIESKKAIQFIGGLAKKDELKLPLRLENVLVVNGNQFMTKIGIKTLARISSFLLNYNFDIQREARRVVRGGETIREATLVMENVEEIKDNLKKGKQETTTIVINASAGTADSGDELIHDPTDDSLVITEGTVLDIVDGYHRCRASELVINENPDIEFEFMLLILNYTDDMAMNYQGQFAKQTPITSTRQKQLAKPRNADTIVDSLMKDSELSGKISTSKAPSLKAKEVVSYDVLTNAIDREFNLERTVDVYKVTTYLKNFFDILLEEYSEQFVDSPLEWKKKSVLVENNMFIGYVVLARRMYEAGLSEIELINYIDKIDFDRNNPLWREIGFLNGKGNLNETDIARKAIKDYFESIEV